MKKIALMVVATLFGSAQMIAQNTETTSTGVTKNPKFRMGVSVSPVISWFNTEGEDSFVNPDGPRTNIAYGLHLDFGLGSSRNYYFSTGIFGLNTGGTLVYNYGEENDSPVQQRAADFRFNYVNIPLTMMLRTNEIGYMVYFARVGFDTGFNIKSNYDSQDKPIGTSSTTSQNDVSSPDFASLLRLGLHLEAGLEFNVTGTTNLFVTVEYNNGLNNVFSKELDAFKGPNNLDRIKGTSNFLAVNLGVYF